MRKIREKQPGAVYHVVAKTNRSEFMLESKLVKQMFLVLLKTALKKYPCQLNHFCIMSNHVHILIEPLDGTDLSQMMQWLLSVFAIRFNRLYGLKGHVWYDRFKSTIVKSLEHFKNSYRYISENPVKAGMCTSPEEYEFSGLHWVDHLLRSVKRVIFE